MKLFAECEKWVLRNLGFYICNSSRRFLGVKKILVKNRVTREIKKNLTERRLMDLDDLQNMNVYIVRASSLEVDGARGHLNSETEIKLVTGMISEIVSTADAIKSPRLTTPLSHLETWEKTPKAFENLGMAVGSNDHGYIS